MQNRPYNALAPIFDDVIEPFHYKDEELLAFRQGCIHPESRHSFYQSLELRSLATLSCLRALRTLSRAEKV